MRCPLLPAGPNTSDGWRHAYVLAFRKTSCIAEERSWGFTHSHNDQHSWDVFNKWAGAGGPEADKAEASA